MPVSDALPARLSQTVLAAASADSYPSFFSAYTGSPSFAVRRPSRSHHHRKSTTSVRNEEKLSGCSASPQKNEGRQVPTDPRSQELARDQCGGAVEHPTQF